MVLIHEFPYPMAVDPIRLHAWVVNPADSLWIVSGALFGTLEVVAPLLKPCRCRIASQRTIAPVAEIMRDRCTFEYEHVLAELGHGCLIAGGASVSGRRLPARR